MTDIDRLHSLPTDSTEFYATAHDIVMDDTATMADRLEALRLLDRAMGGTGEPLTPEVVADYIRTHQEG